MIDKIEKIEHQFGYLKVDGKWYTQSTADGKPVFKIIDKKQVEKKIKLAKEVAKEIEGSLDREAVITEAIMRFDNLADVENLHNLVFNKKRKYKAKTREHRCVDMKVGNFIIPIVD